jgi:hypothetical protein
MCGSSGSWSQRIGLTSLLALLWMGMFAHAQNFDCMRFDSNMGATFDMSEIVRGSDDVSYMIEDGDNVFCEKEVVEKNYTYVFNVCGPVGRGVPYSCRTLDGLSSAGAIQYNKYDNKCYLAGGLSHSLSHLKVHFNGCILWWLLKCSSNFLLI